MMETMIVRTNVNVTDEFVKAVDECPIPAANLSEWLGYGKGWLRQCIKKKRLDEYAMRKICLNILEADPDPFIAKYPYACCGSCIYRSKEILSGEMVCASRFSDHFGEEMPYEQRACTEYVNHPNK